MGRNALKAPERADEVGGRSGSDSGREGEPRISRSYHAVLAGRAGTAREMLLAAPPQYLLVFPAWRESERRLSPSRAWARTAPVAGISSADPSGRTCARRSRCRSGAAGRSFAPYRAASLP